jgi:hypothetical protein
LLPAERTTGRTALDITLSTCNESAYAKEARRKRRA